MRPHGKTKLGLFPLPIPEAKRLRKCLTFPPEFSAIDPCVGDGVAFVHLLKGTEARRYGIEIDANRAEQARQLGIETLQANAMDVRCPAESISLLYLNPPMTSRPARRTISAWNRCFSKLWLAHACKELGENDHQDQAAPRPSHRRGAARSSRAKAHLMSVVGGDTQISAIRAAISMGDCFLVEGPEVEPIRVWLERNAQCFRGSIQLPERKKPLRHLVGMSEEFTSGNVCAGSGRTL